MGENKKVLVVKAGGFGDLSAAAGSYDSQAEFIQRVLQGCAEVEVVNAMPEEEQLRGVDAVIFLTRGLLGSARRLKAKVGRWCKVIVLTSLLPDDEVVLLDKGWLTRDFLREILL